MLDKNYIAFIAVFYRTTVWEGDARTLNSLVSQWKSQNLTIGVFKAVDYSVRGPLTLILVKKSESPPSDISEVSRNV